MAYRNLRIVPLLIFGRGSVSQLGAVLSAQRKSPPSAAVFLIDRVHRGKAFVQQLPVAQEDLVLFVNVDHEPKTSYVDELTERTRAACSEQPCAVVGIGGGSDEARKLEDEDEDQGKEGGDGHGKEGAEGDAAGGEKGQPEKNQRERPEEIVLVGCHFDSWDAATGASDNAVGCIVTWEGLRLMKALGIQPRRTVRVVQKRTNTCFRPYSFSRKPKS